MFLITCNTLNKERLLLGYDQYWFIQNIHTCVCVNLYLSVHMFVAAPMTTAMLKSCLLECHSPSPDEVRLRDSHHRAPRIYSYRELKRSREYTVNCHPRVILKRSPSVSFQEKKKIFPKIVSKIFCDKFYQRKY